jgi:hypothetical protein
MDIGISGGDTDQFGATLAITDNATSDNTDATAVWSNPILADTAAIITFNGGNCTAGTVYLTIYYHSFSAPSAD